MKTIYDFDVLDIDGKARSLREFEGKVVVIVNVASKCGLTPQYAELQALYDQKKDEGLVILGFPANDFAGQEPGENQEIKAFCEAHFGVNFPMFSKISVKGAGMHPLFRFLVEQTGAEVSWNFQKFIIDRTGVPRNATPPTVTVADPHFSATLAELL